MQISEGVCAVLITLIDLTPPYYSMHFSPEKERNLIKCCNPFSTFCISPVFFVTEKHTCKYRVQCTRQASGITSIRYSHNQNIVKPTNKLKGYRSK